MMMLQKLMVFVMVFFLGTLASPAANPQGEDAPPATEGSDLATRSGTRWTWYDVQTGNEVYCGGYRHNNEAIVALSGVNMNRSLCGKRIRMTYNGVTTYATVVDMCPASSCPAWAIDLSPSLFSNFAPQSVGVIYGDWSFV